MNHRQTPEYKAYLRLPKEERAEVRAAFKRLENSPRFKESMKRAKEMFRRLKTSSDPETRVRNGGKP